MSTFFFPSVTSFFKKNFQHQAVMFKTYGLTQIFSPGLRFRFRESLYEVSWGTEYTPTNTHKQPTLKSCFLPSSWAKWELKPSKRDGMWADHHGNAHLQIYTVTRFFFFHVISYFGGFWLVILPSWISFISLWSVPLCFYRANPDFCHQCQVKWTARFFTFQPPRLAVLCKLQIF